MKKSSGNSNAPKAVQNQNSQQTNANKGTAGTNTHYDKAMGHRGTQIASNKKNP